MVRLDYESNYLLTGFARYACGSSLAVVSRSHGRSRRFFYGCLAFAKRGPTVCANDVVLPLERVDDAVLKALRGDVLRPAVVSAIIDEFLRQLLPANLDARIAELRSTLRSVETKIAHLTAAIEQGGPLSSLVALLTERQAERETLLVDLGVAETQAASSDGLRDRRGPGAADRRAVAAAAHGVDRRRASTATRCVGGAAVFTGVGRSYRFRGRVATGRLIAGAVHGQECVASPSVPSWNQIVRWLASMAELQRAGIAAA